MILLEYSFGRLYIDQIYLGVVGGTLIDSFAKGTTASTLRSGQCEPFHASQRAGVVLSQDLSAPLQHLLMQPGGLLHPALMPVCHSEVVHADQRVGVVLSQNLLAPLQHLLMQPGGLLHPALMSVCLSEVTHAAQRVGVVFSQEMELCLHHLLKITSAICNLAVTPV